MSEPFEVQCHAYTKARRHPKVIGVIGGKVMPWPSTTTQLGVFLATAIGLAKFRSLWGAFLPMPLQAVLIMGLPCLAWWAVRYWRPEDREPMRAARGFANYAMRPRGGSRHGRQVRMGRGTVVVGQFFLAGIR